MAAMFLTVVAAIGTQSRGALLGSAQWCVPLAQVQAQDPDWIFMLIAALVVVQFMPESWYQRMATLQTYEQDGSAMGRINAWYMAFNLASNECSRGFGTFKSRISIDMRRIPRSTPMHIASFSRCWVSTAFRDSRSTCCS